MLAALILSAAQAAAPVPPTPPAPAPGNRTVIREIVIHEGGTKAAKADDKREQREIIVIRNGDRDPKAAERRVRIIDRRPATPGEQRHVHILRPGGERLAMIDCAEGSKIDSETTAADGKKTRVMVCASGGSDVSRVQRLRDAAKRIGTDPKLSREARIKVVAAINEAIARLPVNE